MAKFQCPPELVAAAKAAAQRERDLIFEKTGILITDDPINPFRAVIHPRISVYRQVAREDIRHE